MTALLPHVDLLPDEIRQGLALGHCEIRHTEVERAVLFGPFNALLELAQNAASFLGNVNWLVAHVASNGSWALAVENSNAGRLSNPLFIS